MTELKQRRQRAIAEIIRGGTLSSQEELAERLSKLGFAVTQATISRDLEQIGAVKVRRDGQLSYALQDQPQVDAGRLAVLLREFVISIDSAANLLVIKTPPGSAHLIGVALDQSDVPDIVGTICGDDTIFAACRTASAAEALAGKMRSESLNLQ
ncbi:MAG TPA: arginine repressor [Sphingomicrobium sp.]|nr:arginine repressor [Sphingomicrobium sp.]